MTGKGLALINDPGDRKFVVYNDADNYIEMFMREKDTSELLKTGWGFRGVVDGKEVSSSVILTREGRLSVRSGSAWMI